MNQNRHGGPVRPRPGKPKPKNLAGAATAVLLAVLLLGVLVPACSMAPYVQGLRQEICGHDEEGNVTGIHGTIRKGIDGGGKLVVGLVPAMIDADTREGLETLVAAPFLAAAWALCLVPGAGLGAVGLVAEGLDTAQDAAGMIERAPAKTKIHSPTSTGGTGEGAGEMNAEPAPSGPSPLPPLPEPEMPR